MRESNDSNAVEVNGICFETLMPERVLRLPRKKRGINTPVQLGIGVTNNTQETLHFSFYCTLTPRLVKADEKALRAGYFSDEFAPPQESDYPLIMPGKCLTFFPYAKLLWLEGEQFELLIAAGDGGFWTFRIQPDTYQFRFSYRKLNAFRRSTSAEWDTIEPRLSKRVWSGLVDTPIVEFHIVQP